MRVSLIQSDIVWNNPRQSVARCEPLIEEALASGGQVLIFPEMFTCGFSMPTGKLAQESFLQGWELLRSVATTHAVFTVGSLPELASDGTQYNTAWIFGPDGTLRDSYRKVQLFSFGGEVAPYSPGCQVRSIPLDNAAGSTLRCSVRICYDLRFAPLFWECAPRTDLFVVVANWPAVRREHWLTLLRARAIENQAYVAGVNRVGSGGGLTYAGDSVLFAPDGTECGKLGNTESTLTCDVDPQVVTSWRKTLPALRDRRPELYAGIVSE